MTFGEELEEALDDESIDEDELFGDEEENF